MERLKTYLYISKSKIEALYEQIVDHDSKTTKEFGLDIKIVKASIKSEVSKRDSLISKLNAVVTYIRDNCEVGSVDDPSEYFEGTARLRFGAMPEEMVIWGNQLGDTLLGLSGSSWHLVGVKPVEQTGYGGTFAPIVYHHLKAAATYEKNPTTKVSSSPSDELVISQGLKSVLKDFSAQQDVEFLARRFDRFSFDGTWILIGSPLYVAQRT